MDLDFLIESPVLVKAAVVGVLVIVGGVLLRMTRQPTVADDD